jgi:hypothetical protein
MTILSTVAAILAVMGAVAGFALVIQIIIEEDRS